jgi:DNA primase
MLKHRLVGAAEAIDESMLEQLTPDVSYMEKRGFSEELLREYEVGFYKGRTQNSFMRNRIIFPIRDHEGALVGFTGRSVIDSAEERERLDVRKWFNSSSLHLSAYLPKALLLYNAHRAADVVRGKPLILVEGPIDALSLLRAGIRNVCAVFGASMSKEQEMLIRQMGIRSIIPLFDNDDAGNKCIGKIKRRFGDRDIIQVVDIALPDGKDPGDLTVEEAKEILNAYTV